MPPRRFAANSEPEARLRTEVRHRKFLASLCMATAAVNAVPGWSRRMRAPSMGHSADSKYLYGCW